MYHFDTTHTDVYRPAVQTLRLARFIGANENLGVPLGFAIGVDNDVLIADNENHRVLIYNINDGSLRGSFGEYGTANGRLVQPRKVCMVPQVVLSPADNPFYVVCDRGTRRSRLQLFTPKGIYIRTIAINNVEIVAGLTGTQDRKIVVVDSIRSDVLIFNELGDLIFSFNVISHMKEPGDVAIHDSHYYICDFQDHLVAVFNHTGRLVRKIGENQGILTFPNGIDISDKGDVLVMDSHGNQLHLNVFDTQGNWIGSFSCPGLKVSGIVGLKCTSNHGLLVSLSKNYSKVLVIHPVSLLQ